MRVGLLVLVLIPAPAWTQQSGGLSARALFYREEPDQDKLPPVPTVKPPAEEQKSQPPAGPPPPARKKTRVTEQKTRADEPKVPVIPVVQHLGLRYNVLLVDPGTGAAQPADPDRTFRRGECLALEFEANRSGYLYVLNQGSTGRWQAMFPSDEMPDESNIVRARTKVRVPINHCFEIEDPPGVERMFVVLSRNPEDLYNLHQAIKTGHGGASEPAPGARPVPVQMAMNRLNMEVTRLAGDLQSRDLRVKKIAKPEAAGEPPNSVYVVNASTGAKTPADRVVTEIRIEHK